MCLILKVKVDRTASEEAAPSFCTLLPRFSRKGKAWCRVHYSGMKVFTVPPPCMLGRLKQGWGLRHWGLDRDRCEAVESKLEISLWATFSS